MRLDLNRAKLAAARPISRDSLTEQAYRHLKHLLLVGDLQPGSRLVLREVAKSLGISVTPIREALLQLVAEKSLEVREHGLIVVPELTENACNQLWHLRLLLEGECAEAAAVRATAVTVQELSQAQKEMLRAKQERRLSDALSHNVEFHFALYRAGEMPIMLSLIEDIWARSAAYVHFFQHHHVEKRNAAAKQGPHVHDTIIRAVAARDGTKARRGIERDLLEIRDGILRLLGRPGSRTG